MRTLIIDNYDSFTFNLYQLIARVNDTKPIVVRNDELEWSALAREAFDNIVISPGPGRPERRQDFGVSMEAIESARVPILGVCLGHQGIGYHFGATVRHALEPMHGRLSTIAHDGSELWAGIPQRIQVVRYHSLVVDTELPECLQATAWTDDGTIMALRHRRLPIWGVQFHPESICTEFGQQLLQNFRDLTRRQQDGHHGTSPRARSYVVPEALCAPIEPPPEWTVRSRKVWPKLQPEEFFRRELSDSPLAFWLDSSRAEPGLARFSFMGAGTGPWSRLVKYDAAVGELVETANGETIRRKEAVYAYLDRELRRLRHRSPELPFEFNCGFVGYFGYGLKPGERGTQIGRDDCPDATFLLSDRLIAFDHEQGGAWLVCLGKPGSVDEDAAEKWFDEMQSALCQEAQSLPPPTPNRRPISFRLSRSRQGYLDDIARCKRYMRDGESYEVCLTNQIHSTAVPNVFDTYCQLRTTNPAPYSALLRFGDVSVMSSSPERFLQIDGNGRIESKPIKGTRPRGGTEAEDAALKADLATNEKDRSENLMIVDLLRNDLGAVSEIGSVEVTKLMDVESYETVHQLVSTIRGRLRPELTAVDCVRHAFPGGSMTGAPKLRTMRIIDELENEARGIYSGALGYLALSGAADLSIVIRTIVETATSTSIGVGGALIMLSSAHDEFEETLLKARAPIRALIAASRGRLDDEACQSAIDQLREWGVATV